MERWRSLSRGQKWLTGGGLFLLLWIIGAATGDEGDPVGKALPTETAAPTLTPSPTPTVAPTASPTVRATIAPFVPPRLTAAPRQVTAAPAAAGRSGCDPSYPDVCIKPPPPDLDCKDVPHWRFTVRQPDPHGFDENKDGVGCESTR